MQEMTRF
jgi:hypothetical protein